jgi:hypothetical protein
MVSEDIFHVAIVPLEKLDLKVANTVAAIIRKEPYTTRLLLSGKIPRLAAHYQSQEEATEITRSLKALGLTVFICDDAFLRRSPDAVFRAFTLNVGEDTITFRNQGGESQVTGKQDIFLIIRFDKQHVTVNKTTTTKIKFSLGKTLMTGGIPIFDQKKETTTTESTQTEMILRLYDRASPDNYVEIAQHSMDYSFLGEKRGYSSKANFNTVTELLKTTFPEAIFDDNLVRLSGSKVTTDTDSEMEMNCRLLYLYYRDYYQSLPV